MITPSFTIVLPTAYGPMLVNRHDINQTQSLLKTGRAIDHEEIVMLGKLLGQMGAGGVFLDIGANFGTYSLALAPALGPEGQVHAFEAQRILFNMLAGSVALNGFTNVHCHNLAVGAEVGTIEVPQFDYGAEMNFGSVEFGPQQTERLSQERGHDPKKTEFVDRAPIDRFQFSNVRLIKIDVEGMEMQVLAGAEETIRRCRPLMFIEYLKNDKDALARRIAAFGYFTVPVDINFLCVPNELDGKLVVN
jgi:FkbM family methyltransferase